MNKDRVEAFRADKACKFSADVHMDVKLLKNISQKWNTEREKKNHIYTREEEERIWTNNICFMRYDP